jgi:hypothetical protein
MENVESKVNRIFKKIYGSRMKKLFFVGGFALGILIAFQNCSVGNFKATSSSLTQLNQASGINTSSDFLWSLGSSTGLTVSRLQQVSRWTDSTGMAMNLYPPLMSSTNKLDLDHAPLVTSTDSGSLVNFGNGDYLTTEPGDFYQFLGQSYTVVTYVHNIVLPKASPVVARIFYLRPADGSASGVLGVDVSSDGAGNAVFMAFDWYDNNNVASATLSVPIATLANGFGIAVRFSNDPTKLLLSVNGQSSAAAKIIGNVPLMGDVTRQFIVHSDGFGNAGTFDLAAIGVWKRELADAQVVYYSQSIKDQFENDGTHLVDPGNNSSTTPTTTPSTTPSTTPTGTVTQFSQISSIFSSCTGCHSSSVGSRAAILATMGDDGKTPWIVSGKSANSLLIKSLNHVSGVSPMPANASALSATQIAQIALWIDQGVN